MKQILSLIFCVWFCTSAWAQSGTADFDIDENGVLTGYHGPGGDVVIPDGVTSIGYQAFMNNSDITSVTIPNSVTSIGEAAFYFCINLASVTIPNLVTSIGRQAFFYCRNLTSVTIPGSVTSIDRQAFAYCSNLQSITVEWAIPVNITVSVFEYVNKRNCTLNIPEGTLEAYWVANVWQGFLIDSDFGFNGNGVLINYYGTGGDVVIPDSTRSIGDEAFFGCADLTSVTIPNSVRSIGHEAFFGCLGLTSVTIPGSVTSIGGGAFSACRNLQNITVEWSTPVSIPGNVFEGVDVSNCTLHVPAGTKSLYQAADVWKDFGTIVDGDYSVFNFEVNGIYYRTISENEAEVINNGSPDCYTGRVIIPASVSYEGITYNVTAIGAAAFKDSKAFFVSIPEGVTDIKDEAFKNFALSMLSIPGSVSRIGSGALETGADLYVAWPTPLEAVSAAWGNAVETHRSLYVPVGTKALYESSPYWPLHYKLIAEQETGQPTGDYFADFNDNTFDSNVWHVTRNSESDVRVEDGMMKIEQNVTDKMTFIQSRPFEFVNNKLEISRKVRITPGGDYFGATMDLQFNNGYDIRISYDNTYFYGTGYQTVPLRGIHFNDYGDYIYMNENRVPLGDYENSTFFDEKLVIDKADGIVKYYVNDELRGEVILDKSKLAEIASFRLRFESYGWNTGHKQYFDDLSVKTYSEVDIDKNFPVISDDINEVWYYLQFVKGSAVIQDMGENENLRTKLAQNYVSEQQWKVVASGANTYALVNKSGRFIAFNGERFYASGASDAFRIVATNNHSYSPGWELQRVGGYGSINQCGGFGLYRELGEWEAGDSNNPLLFVPVDSIAVYEPIGDFFTDFNDNVFDTNVWVRLGIPENVRVEDGMMKLEKTAENTDSDLLSREFRFVKEELEISRSLLVTPEYYQYFAYADICFDNAYTLKVNYLNADGYYGIYLDRKDDGYGQVFLCDFPEGNTFFEEKIVLNKLSETVKYYINNTLKAEVSLNGKLTGADSFHLLFGPAVYAHGQIQYFDNFSVKTFSEFEIDENGVLIGYRGAGGDVVIPDGVTAIGNSVFKNNRSITSVVVPDGVASIGNDAFNSCENMTSIRLPEGITEIKEGTFAACRSLTSITLPEGLTSIGSAAFNGCDNLTAIVIPSGVTEIANDVFAGCFSLTSINIPAGVTRIGVNAFNGCASLTSVSVPASVETIGDAAFNGAVSLGEIHVHWSTPYDLSGMDIFNGVPLWNAVLYVPVGTKSLYEAADVWKDFGTIVDGDYSVFNFEVNGIYYRTISENEAEVINNGSPDCYTGRVIIPASVSYEGITYNVTAIGAAAFKDSKAFFVSIPEGVTDIKDEAFKNVALSMLSIPGSVSRIGSGALETGADLYVAWPTPLEAVSAAWGNAVETHRSLYVPVGTKALYESSPYWPLHYKLIAEQETGQPTGNYFADFNDNTFDSNVWHVTRNSESDVRVEDGMMKIEQNVTDKMTFIQSRPFEFVNNELEISRKVRITPGGDYFGATMDLQFNNGYDIRISYDNTYFYGTGYQTVPLRGIHFNDYGDYIYMNENRVPLGDYENSTFFDEKLVIDKADGIVKYYVNDELRGEVILDKSKLAEIASFRLRFESYGWNTGHKQYFDDLSVKTYSEVDIDKNFPVISDDINEVWYYLQFVKGSAVIQDMGENENLRTKLAQNYVSEQQWKVVASGANTYALVNKSGRFIAFNGERFYASGASDAFRIVATNNHSYSPGWELQRVGGYGSINQCGGFGLYRELGEWEAGDSNNPLLFVPVDSIAVYEPIGDFFTDFNDNVFDTNVWVRLGIPENVRVEDGMMKLEKTVENTDSDLLSREFRFVKEELEISRSLLVTPEYYQYFAYADIRFDNAYTLKVNYLNADGYYGIYLDRKDDGYGQVFLCDFPEGNTFFEEKIVLNKLSETVKYYINNTLKAEVSLNGKLTGADSFHLLFGPAVYAHGQIQYFDNFSVKTFSEFEIDENGVLIGYRGAGGDVVIPDGVTAIGNSVFKNNRSITSVVVPDGVASIGNDAFNSCENMTSIRLPEGITEIKEGTFAACRSLTSITLPEGLTSIGGAAFNGCDNLTAIVIPSGVTEIANDVFAGCFSLTSINISAGVTRIGVNAFNGCASLTSVSVPASVETIGDAAFNGAVSLGEIHVHWSTPYDLSGMDIFNGVPLWNAVLYVPVGTKSLYEAADVWKDFGTIVDGDYSVFNFEVNGIYYRTISENEAEVINNGSPDCYTGRVIIPASVSYEGITYNVTAIGAAAFKDSKAFFVSIPEGVTDIKDEAFKNVALSMLSIPGSVSRIGSGALETGADLYVAWPTPLEAVSTAWGNAVEFHRSLYVPVGTKALYESSPYWPLHYKLIAEQETGQPTGNYFADFNDNTFDSNVWHVTRNSESDVRVEDGMMKIEQNVTDKMTFIQSRPFEFVNNELEISRKVRITPGGDYFGATMDLQFNNGYDIRISYDNTYFYGTGYQTVPLRGIHFNDYGDYIYMNENRVPLGDYENSTFFDEKLVIDKADGIVKYYVNDELRGEVILDKSKLAEIASFRLRFESYGWNTGHKQYFDDLSVKTYSEFSDFIIDENGVLIGYRGAGGDVVIPDGVTAIGNSVFENNQSITSVVIPNSVTSIGYRGFAYSGLASITIPESVKSIGDGTFSTCKLTSIFIPHTVEYIGSNVFYQCRSLTEINVDGDNPYYSSESGVLFNKDKSLLMEFPNNKSGDYVIPNTVINIGGGAFDGGNSVLTSIKIPASVINIGYWAFANCNGLTSIEVDNDNMQYASESGVFYNKSKTKLLLYPQSKADVQFSVPNTVEEIDETAMSSNNAYLTSLTLPASVTSIGWNGLGGRALTSIYVYGKTPASLSDYAINVDKTSCVLYVPEGSLEAYRSAAQWGDFVNIVEMVETISVTGISLNKNNLSLAADATEQLTATILPDNATNKNVTWSSSNDSTATVSATGLVTAKAAGSAVITVTTEDGNKADSCSVEVTRPLSGDATLSSLTVNQGTLTPAFDPNTTAYTVTVANEITGITLTATANDAAASVSGDGTKTLSVGENPFDIVVTAEDSTQQTYTVKVTRLPIEVIAVTSVSLDKTSLNLLVNATAQLTAAVLPENASIKNVTWSSSNEAVATVSSTGLVTAKTAGTALVRVTTEDGNKADSCSVEVTRPLSGDATLSSLTVNQGTLTPAFDPNTTAYTVTVANGITGITLTATANDAAASVSGDGTKTLSVGENPFDIVVTAENGTQKIYTVTVTRLEPEVIAVTSISLDQTSLDLFVNETAQLTATVLPENAANKNVTWSSDNEAVATVSATGLVTAKAVGTATITVTAEDGNFAAQCKITVKQEDITVEETKPAGADGTGTLEVSLTVPSDASFEGSFFIEFPVGLILNQMLTALVPELAAQYELTMENISEGKWLFTITPKTLRGKQDLVATKIMDIVYQVETETEDGDYEVEITDLEFDFDDGTTVSIPEITVSVTVDHEYTDIRNASAENPTVSVKDNMLRVKSSVAERIYVYSTNGILLYTNHKQAGEVLFGIGSLSDKVLIVKGNSGWVKKVNK